MKYLRKFETEADVNMSVAPNVVLVGDTGRVIYNVLNGVFIQHIDGTLYTTDEWTAQGFTNDQANGVAVGNGTVKFVIAKENASTANMMWSSSKYWYSAIDGAVIADNLGAAKNDYAGVSNTAAISTVDSESAAAACQNYTFPNGKSGYLPAAGEWSVVDKYRNLIISAFAIIGGTSFTEYTSYWSSTQSSGSKAWKWDNKTISSGYLNYEKTSKSLVRAFTTL